MKYRVLMPYRRGETRYAVGAEITIDGPIGHGKIGRVLEPIQEPAQPVSSQEIPEACSVDAVVSPELLELEPISEPAPIQENKPDVAPSPEVSPKPLLKSAPKPMARVFQKPKTKKTIKGE